jgi:hypothetical protein
VEPPAAKKVETKEPGALYVSSNEKEGPVTRYGLGISAGSFNYIGATRTAATGAKTIVFDEALIVKIPPAEAARFLAEYSRAISSGALRERSFEDYAKQLKADDELMAKEEIAEKTRQEKLALAQRLAAATPDKTTSASPPLGDS